MSTSVNKVFLIGNLCHDPELKYLESGTGKTTFSLALNRTWTKDGQKNEEVCFIDVTCWGKLADNVAEYCKKGKQVYVEGYLKQDRWEDAKTQQKRTKLYVTAEQVKFLGRKEDGGASPPEPTVVPDNDEVPF